MLDAFGLTNTELGDLFAVYGFTAILAYFPGGALADRFSARFLLSASLFATAAGGLYMATIPDVQQMAVNLFFFARSGSVTHDGRSRIGWERKKEFPAS